MKKLTALQITEAGVLLALCIASQFFKNISVYITGPIINALIVLAVLLTGLAPAILISIVTPITAFIITGSPVMKAIPLIIPAVMLGNILLAVCTFAFKEKMKSKAGLPAGLLAGSLLKALFMGCVIGLVLLPLFGGGLAPQAVAAARVTFSVTQLITALTGSAVALLIWQPLKRFVKNPNI